MKELIDTPMFGVIVSIIAYEVGLIIYRKTNLPIFNPLLIGALLVIGPLLKFNIPLDSYNKGGSLISFFLGPATVVLAVPLYKQLNNLRANIVPIIGGILTGSISAVTSAWFLSTLFKLDRSMALSLVPKSVTTPIGMAVSKQIGGIPPITVAAIIITGIIGAVIGPSVCRFCRITDKIAVGIAMGTSSHAVGTTKAVEIGETEGAMSSLAIGVAGLVTVFLAPLLVKFI